MGIKAKHGIVETKLKPPRTKRQKTKKTGAQKKAEDERLSRMDIRIGDTVELDKERWGIVRYIGTVEFADNMRYGIEFTDGFSTGKHDGTVQGVTYFVCPPN